MQVEIAPKVLLHKLHVGLILYLRESVYGRKDPTLNNHPLLKIWIRLYQLIKGAGEIELSAFASSSAFFLFLSLIPILILITSLIPYTGISQTELSLMVHDSIGQIAPETVTKMVEQLIDTIFSGGALSLSLSALITLWTASKSFLALMRGMDVIHGDGRQGYLIARIKSCFYTFIMIIVIVGMLVVVVFGRKLARFIGGYIPTLLPILKWILTRRFLLAWLILACVFTAIYTWVPKKRLRLRDQIPGAVFSSAAWIAFSALFSLYISKGGSFGIYGSLATIVIALIWMYYCMYILLLGTYLNVNRKDEKPS